MIILIRVDLSGDRKLREIYCMQLQLTHRHFTFTDGRGERLRAIMFIIRTNLPGGRMFGEDILYQITAYAPPYLVGGPEKRKTPADSTHGVLKKGWRELLKMRLNGPAVTDAVQYKR